MGSSPLRALWGVFPNGELVPKERAAPSQHALLTLHYDLAFRKASSLSGARNLPLRRLGGTTASMASSFSVGSARTYTSVVVRLLCPNHRETFRMSCVACNTTMALVWRSTWGDICLACSVEHFRSAVSV